MLVSVMLLGWLWAGYGLAVGYQSAIYGLAMGCLWSNYGLAIDWLSAIYWLSNGYRWILAGYQQPISWQLVGNRMAISWLSAMYWLTMDWPWACYNGLALGYQSAGYRLAIGWLCPQINTLQDTYTMYQSGTWLLSILCSQAFLAISRLSTGYWLAMSHNQYNSRHSHILLCIKVAQGCYQYFGL